MLIAFRLVTRTLWAPGIMLPWVPLNHNICQIIVWALGPIYHGSFSPFFIFYFPFFSTVLKLGLIAFRHSCHPIGTGLNCFLLNPYYSKLLHASQAVNSQFEILLMAMEGFFELLHKQPSIYGSCIRSKSKIRTRTYNYRKWSKKIRHRREERTEYQSKDKHT